MAQDIQRITGTKAIVAARLCNFPTGSAELLPAHITFVDKEVAAVLRGMQGPWVDLFAYASRRGNAAFNLTLSEHRLKAVKGQIRRHADRVNFQIQRGLGETESGTAEENNSGYWRAVDVYVYASRPTSPSARPQAVDTAATFEIRVVGGASASALAQADNYLFQIVDLVRRKTAFFHYSGLVGFGVSIPKIPGIGSMTKAGPPAQFQTTQPAELHMFNSKATLLQDPGASMGSESQSVGGKLRLSIDEIERFAGFIFTKPSPIVIEGGWGIQMPGLGSITKGVLAQVSAVLPFSGY